jgi:hypothetical protein
MSYTIRTKCSNEGGKKFLSILNYNQKIINKILADSVNENHKSINKKNDGSSESLSEFYYEEGYLNLNINGLNSQYYRAFSAIMAWVSTKTKTFKFEIDNIEQLIHIIIIKDLKDIQNLNDINKKNLYFVNKDGVSMKFLTGDKKLLKIFKQTNYKKMFESLNELNNEYLTIDLN